MASIRKEIRIDAPADRVWDALQDVGALHTKLVPGFVTDTRMEGKSARVVTFHTGMVAREEILSIDPAQRRVAWAVIDGPFRHFNGAARVSEDPHGGSRFIWTTDLLPDDMANQVEQLMSSGIAVIKKTLETKASAA
jgi:hypothetical protein